MFSQHRAVWLSPKDVSENALEQIGIGTYGNVFKINHCGATCTAKQLHAAPKGFLSTNNCDEFLKQCLQISELRHPNLVQFLGVCLKQDRTYKRVPLLVMEMMEESLTSLLERCSRPDSNTQLVFRHKLSILLHVSYGLLYLHSHDPPIAHCRLSSNKVLLKHPGTDQMQVKISDSGVVSLIKHNTRANIAFPGNEFLPQPLENSIQFDTQKCSVDMFSYGGVVLHMVTQKWPKPLVTKYPKSSWTDNYEISRRLPYIKMISDDDVDCFKLKNLVIQCLNDRSHHRPNINDAAEKLREIISNHSMHPDDSSSQQIRGANANQGGANVEQTVDIMQLVEEVELLKQNVHTQDKKLEQKNQEICQKDKEIHRHTEEKMLLWQEISKRDQEIMQRNLLINQKEQINRDMQQKHNKMQKQIQQKDDEIKEKAQELQYRSNRIQQAEQELKQKNFEIRQKDETIQQKDETIQQKDKEIQQKDKEIQQKDEAIQQKDEEMQQKDEEICLIGQEIEEKDQQILQLEDDISSLQQRVSDLQKPTWIIKKHDIILSRQVVGRGGWGSVQEALYHGCKVAVKSLYQSIISNYNLQLFAREMNMAARCRHPNLLQFIGATSTLEEIPLIVTELMHTSLRKTLERNKLCSNQVVPISLGVAYGLNYLHKTTPNAILHRDVSSANVLLNPLPNNQWHPKLSDFGSTNFMIACHTINAGNPTYAAPEALEGQHTPAMDVFSFGVLMFEMCSRKFPTEKPNALILRHVKWPITETKLVGLIQSCLSTELQMRSTMEQLIDELRKCE